ncbi:MAG: hypothetical protein V4481_04785 [Patescibacteria group bacterium]
MTAKIAEYYTPDKKCVDTNMLKKFVESSVLELDTSIGNDLSEFRRILTLLKNVIEVSQPNLSVRRVVLSGFVSIFKKLYIPRGESDICGPHVSIVRDVLRWPKTESEPQGNLANKLKDKFCETLDAEKVLSLYEIGMLDDTKSCELLISLLCATGCRKAEILNRKDSRGELVVCFAEANSQNQFIGSETNELTKIETADAIPISHQIVQTGKAKDAKTRINKFLTPGDERFQQGSVLVKPTIILSSHAIVQGIEMFRKRNPLLVDTNLISSPDLKHIITNLFPKASKQSEENGWNMLSHFCRRMYAYTCYKTYKRAIKSKTGKAVDKAMFTAAVLGHKDMKDSISYAAVSD